MTEPNPVTLEILGRLFAKTRVEQNFDLDDLSEQLRIPKHYLLAIEAGVTDRLPEPVYVRGFIRKYAQILQLDNNPLVQQFFTRKIEPIPPIAKLDLSYQEPRKTSPTVKWVVYGLVAAALVVGLSAAVRTYLPQLAVTPPPEPVTPEPKKSVVLPSKPTPAPVTGMNLATAVTDATWLRVIVDGKNQFEGILKKGETRTWQAQKSLNVRSGNAGAVMLTYNNQPIGPMGKPGQPLTRTFEKGVTPAKS